MPKTDPYRLTGTDGTSSPGPTRRDVLRSMLWVLVVISTVANMAASYADAHTWVHLACGAVTVVCGGSLVVRSLRGRR
ncbi:hypothetical protein [Streptantibioticus ferralitis]|uniref:Uncharacterized protein n=1 Tax=Streptantibioticus ferralitis TaxID=236510 RepID=A0ABT5Z302_9ACTN|nr:hypothetical protein [Streptantibioticus ferralitis]MDF2257415.1 hypothetical protein [Streptantibioticus ferralitis]